MKGMKLIIAIVHDDDATKVVKELNKQGFRVTRMCSSGGFLKAGNTTLMVGVDEEGVDKVLSVIEMKSKARQETVNSAMTSAGTMGYMSYPIEVTVGGATVFVLDVNRFEKF